MKKRLTDKEKYIQKFIPPEKTAEVKVIVLEPEKKEGTRPPKATFKNPTKIKALPEVQKQEVPKQRLKFVKAGKFDIPFMPRDIYLPHMDRLVERETKPKKKSFWKNYV